MLRARLVASALTIALLPLLVLLASARNEGAYAHVGTSSTEPEATGHLRAHEEGQHGTSEGHLPDSSENVELVGSLRVHDARPGRISDVAGLGSFAYLGAYAAPDCKKGGVYVIDISDPTRPKEVNFIRTAPDTYVSEGVQVLHVTTHKFNGDLLVHNNEICGPNQHAIGGISLVDVTNPKKTNPTDILAAGVGDTNNGTLPRARQVHSAFAWDAGNNAYVIMVDDEELLDVDIMDITDPRNPVLIAETGLPDWPAAQAPLANGDTTFFHDVQVRQFGSQWIALLSYWDAGWVRLNVTDPANPVFLNDTDYPDPDPVTGFSPSEGNAHQAWWSADGQFFLGTDEDFAAYRNEFHITTGLNAGEYPAAEFDWVVPINNLTDGTLNGPTVFGGYGCPDDLADIPDPSVLGSLALGEEAILVLQRGPIGDPNHPHDACFFSLKVEAAQNKGYDAVIIANHHVGAGAGASPDAHLCGSKGHEFTVTIHGVCIGHRAMHLLFNTTPTYDVPYKLSTDPGYTEPAIGTLGAEIEATSLFDGHGYVHLFNANTLQEIDQLTIPETFNPAFATGFGDLTVHEVETDDEENLAYFSWYSGGFRVARFDNSGIEEVGHFIAPGGNNFWGIDPHQDPRDGSTIILASDRDSGLWIFRYTGD